MPKKIVSANARIEGTVVVVKVETTPDNITGDTPPADVSLVILDSDLKVIDTFDDKDPVKRKQAFETKCRELTRALQDKKQGESDKRFAEVNQVAPAKTKSTAKTEGQSDKTKSA